MASGTHHRGAGALVNPNKGTSGFIAIAISKPNLHTPQPSAALYSTVHNCTRKPYSEGRVVVGGGSCQVRRLRERERKHDLD
jgi:hypothetical protein